MTCGSFDVLPGARVCGTPPFWKAEPQGSVKLSPGPDGDVLWYVHVRIGPPLHWCQRTVRVRRVGDERRDSSAGNHRPHGSIPAAGVTISRGSGPFSDPTP